MWLIISLLYGQGFEIYLLCWRILFGHWVREIVLTYRIIFDVPLEAYLIWLECLFKTELKQLRETINEGGLKLSNSATFVHHTKIDGG